MSELPDSNEQRLTARLQEAVAQLEEVDRQLAQLRSEREQQHDDDEHDPDGVSLSSEWSRLEGLRRSRVDAITGIEQAQARLADGDYGICTGCGSRIPRERLEVRPDATTCVDCAR